MLVQARNIENLLVKAAKDVQLTASFHVKRVPSEPRLKITELITDPAYQLFARTIITFLAGPMITDTFSNHMERREFLKKISGEPLVLYENNQLRVNNIVGVLLFADLLEENPKFADIARSFAAISNELRMNYSTWSNDRKTDFVVKKVQPLFTETLELLLQR